jgi:ABC-type Fe3+ transport system permease subunit
VPTLPGYAGRPAGGFVTTQFVLAVAFSLLLFVMLCNAIVYQYGRGVLRDALDEAVRNGSRAGGSTASCQQAAEEVRRTLLGGPVGAHVSLRCGLAAGRVQASASGYMTSWLPLVPDFPVALSATAVKEPFSAPPTAKGPEPLAAPPTTGGPEGPP